MDNNGHAMDSITWSEFVDEAERRGACDHGLEWARSLSDWPTLWEYAAWVMEKMRDRLTDEQLWMLAQREPAAALVFCFDRLTDLQLWEIEQQAPWVALEYCRNRLTDEQIKQLREMV